MNSRRRVNSSVMRANSKMPRSPQWLLCLVALTIVHAISLVVLYYDETGLRQSLLILFIGRNGFVYAFGIAPIFLLPIVLGTVARSWKQFAWLLSGVLVAWQLEFLLLDWLVGRLTDPFWLRENSLRFTREIIARFVLAAALFGVGGLLGLLKRKYLLSLRSKHA
jgi:hypothetical protein